MFGWILSIFSDSSICATESLNQAQTRIQELERTNGNLQKQIAKLKDIEREGKQQVIRLEKDLRLQNMQNATLEDERRKLKRMITNADLDRDEPIDNELEQRFGTIRGDIQKLVRNLDVRSGPLHLKDCKKQTVAFYKAYWVAEDLNANRLRLRAQIFEIIMEKIFEARCFGLECDMENALAKLESRLDTGNGTQRKAAAAWRKLTIQSINMLGLENVFPIATADTIIDLIRPFAAHSQGKNKKICDVIDTICASAYALTIKFRQSKSTYRISSVGAGTILAGNELDQCEVIGYEGPNFEDQGIPGSKVSYTVFGAMLKSDLGCGEELVLEKAKVICTK